MGRRPGVGELVFFVVVLAALVARRISAGRWSGCGRWPPSRLRRARPPRRSAAARSRCRGPSPASTLIGWTMAGPDLGGVLAAGHRDLRAGARPAHDLRHQHRRGLCGDRLRVLRRRAPVAPAAAALLSRRRRDRGPRRPAAAGTRAAARDLAAAQRDPGRRAGRARVEPGAGGPGRGPGGGRRDRRQHAGERRVPRGGGDRGVGRHRALRLSQRGRAAGAPGHGDGRGRPGGFHGPVRRWCRTTRSARSPRASITWCAGSPSASSCARPSAST